MPNDKKQNSAREIDISLDGVAGLEGRGHLPSGSRVDIRLDGEPRRTTVVPDEIDKTEMELVNRHHEKMKKQGYDPQQEDKRHGV